VLCVRSLEVSCPEWSYNETLGNGPSNWGNLCPEYANCSLSQVQSPINLKHNREICGHVHDLEFNYSNIYDFSFVNRDFTVEAIHFDSTHAIFFHSNHYILQRIHFHAPAEHLIDGVQYPLEAHYVHSNENGALAVLTFLFNSCPHAVAESVLSTLVDYLPRISNPGSSTTVPMLDLSHLAVDDSGFYHYVGSTTTPPCVQNVDFIISKKAILIEPDIIEVFENVLDNARPLQQLNGRVVELYLGHDDG